MAKAVDRKHELRRLKDAARARGGRCLSPEYLGSQVPLSFICKNKHTWSAVPASINVGTWCGECAGNTFGTLKSFEVAAAKRDYESRAVEYKGSHTPLPVYCPGCENEFLISPTNLKTGKGCRSCYRRRKGLPQRKSEAAVRKLCERKGLEFIEYAYPDAMVRHPQCGHIFPKKTVDLKTLKLHRACPTCSPPRYEEQHMRSFAATHGLRCLRRVEDPERDATFEWECLRCSNVFERPKQSMDKTPGCPRCSPRRLGEKLARAWMEKIFGVPFPEAAPEFLQRGPDKRHRLRFDGYNESLAIAFEHHGEQHHKEVVYYQKGKRTLAYQQLRDRDKQRLCVGQRVRLVIIPDLVNQEKVLRAVRDGERFMPVPDALRMALRVAGVEAPPGGLEKLLDYHVFLRVHSRSLRRAIEALQPHARRCGFILELPAEDTPFFTTDHEVFGICDAAGHRFTKRLNKVKASKTCAVCWKLRGAGRA